MASSTDLSCRRTFLAYDRTLLAWIRTAVSLISFGFSVYKFFDYLIQSKDFHPSQGLIGPREFAAGMIGLGVLSLAGATFQYRQTLRILQKDMGEGYRSATGLLSTAVSIMGLSLLAAVLLNL